MRGLLKPSRILPGSAPRSFLEEYEIVRYLSSGAFGDVWACEGKRTGEEFACKVLQKSRIQTDAQREDVRREVSIMTALQGSAGGDPHPGVVALREVLETEREVHMVMEMCRGGDLYSLLTQRGPLPEAAARALFRQLASAVGHCHAQGIVHRDVKPENILLDRPGACLYNPADAWTSSCEPPAQAKLADFGLSVLLSPQERFITGCAGSLCYVAPEMLRGLPYDAKVDVWSLGIVLCTLLTAHLPFSGPGGEDDKQGLAQAILRGQVDWRQPYWRHVSPGARSLILLLLEQDPAQRPTAEEVLAHPWVADPPSGASTGLARGHRRPRVKALTGPLAPRLDPNYRHVRPPVASLRSQCLGKCGASARRQEEASMLAADEGRLQGPGGKEQSPADASQKENQGVPRAPHSWRARASSPRQGLAAAADEQCECSLRGAVTPRSRRIGNLILKGIQAC